MASGLNRREILAGAAGIGLVGCSSGADSEDTDLPPTPERAPEPDPWVPTHALDAAAFAWCLIVSDPLPDGVLCSIRTTETAVQFVLMKEDGAGWIEVDRQGAPALAGGYAHFEFTGLAADTAYTVAAVTSDGRGSTPTRFRTALAADGWRKLTIAATSCLGGPDRPWPSMSAVAPLRADVLFLLGDTIYADGSVDVADFRLKWAEALSTAGIRDLCASTSVVATWDDHEVDNNWWQLGVPAEEVQAAIDTWFEAIPWRVGPEGTGIWRKSSWGQVADVFVLDCRGERDGEQYISPQQMSWLKTGLSGSTARFKLILNSVPITDFSSTLGTVEADDRWQGHVAQRTEILSHIRDEAIGGVLWISGDMHFAMVAKVDPARAAGEDQVEVMVGPAGSRLNELVDLIQTEDPQWDLFLGEWNTTTFELDPGLGTIRVQFVGDDGSVLAERLLEV